MAIEFKKITFLKVYTGEDIMYGDKPLYKAIISEARRLGLAGGTIVKGIGGYATTVRGLGRFVNNFCSGNSNMPIMVEIVDARENIDKILPFLEKNATNALVLVEEATSLLTDYMRQREREQEAAKLKEK